MRFRGSLVAVVAAGLALMGAAAPAQATTAEFQAATATSEGIVVGEANPNPITITLTAATTTDGNAGFSVQLPSGWSFVAPYSPVPWGTSHAALTSVTGCSPSISAAQNDDGAVGFPELWVYCNAVVEAGTTYTFELPAGVVTAGDGTVFIASTVQYLGETVVDQSEITLNAPASLAEVIFDANGGDGEMAAQTSAEPAALTPNAFTREGYRFVGWNTEPDGLGAGYGDEETYPFDASITLYAQWEPELASTGVSGEALQRMLAVAVLFGVGAVLYRRRHATP